MISLESLLFIRFQFRYLIKHKLLQKYFVDNIYKHGVDLIFWSVYIKILIIIIPAGLHTALAR